DHRDNEQEHQTDPSERIVAIQNTPDQPRKQARGHDIPGGDSKLAHRFLVVALPGRPARGTALRFGVFVFTLLLFFSWKAPLKSGLSFRFCASTCRPLSCRSSN